MAKESIHFGKTSIDFQYDPKLWELLAPSQSDLPIVSQNDILVTMSNPIDSQPLEEIIDAGEKVLIAVSDATRSTGSERIVPLLVGRLIECGLRTADLGIIFSTGIHRRPTEEEKRRLITDAVFDAIRTFDHNPDAPDELISLGETTMGTPVEINRRLAEADHVILTGSIGFHYFAGFTGGRKSALPGLASAEAIKRNHLLAIDFDGSFARRRNGVGAGRLFRNPVHEDMEQAAAMLAPSFLLNAILNERREIEQIFCGDWRGAHYRGCAEYAERHTARISEKRALVVASCGGFPKDINLIQAHKTLDMAVGALIEGGDVVLLAECSEGLGRDDFLKWFDAPNSSAIGERLCSQYQVNGQTAWALRDKTERFRVTLVSELPDEWVLKMGMRPARNLESALEKIPQTEGYLIANAAEVIPLVTNVEP